MLKMHKDLSHSRLIDALDYDELTGIFRWKLPIHRGAKVGEIAGTDNNGYLSIHIYGVGYKAHRLAWFYVHHYFPENIIDHIDRVKDHNWISNLIESTTSCNLRNKGLHPNNTSGIAGVNKKGNLWYVYVSENGTLIRIG